MPPGRIRLLTRCVVLLAMIAAATSAAGCASDARLARFTGSPPAELLTAPSAPPTSPAHPLFPASGGPADESAPHESLFVLGQDVELDPPLFEPQDPFRADLQVDAEFPETAASPSQHSQRPRTILALAQDQWSRICTDHLEYYSPYGLSWLAIVVGTGAVLANTAIDEHALRDVYLENIVFAPSNELYETLHQPKFLGDGRFTIPAFAIAALAEPWIADLPAGPLVAQWGQRSLRTILVGGPSVLALQVLTGGSRPGETPAESKWKPFQDDNGVSGHSFMGAIPFMSAAKMTDNLWLKAGLYAVSTLPALSRINDDAHYFSQVFLGWSLAYLAASAVDRTETGRTGLRFYPLVSGNGVGFLLERSF